MIQNYIVEIGILWVWFLVDTLWVAMTNWWIIPGLEDLNYLWHDPAIKRFKMLQMLPVSLLFALIFAVLCMGLVRIW